MIKLNIMSSAEKVKGHGVASAYRELVDLLKKQDDNMYQLTINRWVQADVTHYHTLAPSFYLSTFSKKTGTKVGYVHFLPETMEGSLQMPSPIRKLFDNYIIWFYKRMDELVVVNPSFIPKLEAYGLERKHIHYIPNFVSSQTFYPVSARERRALRKQHSLKEQSFIVLGVGQVQYRKGILDFIAVAKRMPDVQFIWVGGFSFGKITSGYSELKKIYENPPANVKFVGIVDREAMNTYYNLADLLFLPSFNELFPMAILEAMNVERPLLLRELPLYEDILFDYYLKGQSINEFVAKIRSLKENDSYYAKAKQKAAKGARHYSEERLAEIWNDFYTLMAWKRGQMVHGYKHSI